METSGTGHPVSGKYYDEDAFIKLNRNGKRFCDIFSLNIRSLPSNGGELLYFLQTLETFLVLLL